MPGRNQQGDYRYAYQGQEKDPETGWEAFELRIACPETSGYDGRVGRWMTTDPPSSRDKPYSQYHSPYLAIGNNPVKMIDPDGGFALGLDWIPEIETTTEGTRRLVLQKETGDNLESLEKFLGGNGSAEKLYSSMDKSGKIILTNDVLGVAAINSALNNSKDYNCYSSALHVSANINMNGGTYKIWVDKAIFKHLITNAYDDVTDTPENYMFARTAIRFGKTKSNWLYGEYNSTEHAAIYLGTSRDGTIYTWSKNGSVSPGIFTLDALKTIYSSKVEGYREKKGGGFYNINDYSMIMNYLKRTFGSHPF